MGKNSESNTPTSPGAERPSGPLKQNGPTYEQILAAHTNYFQDIAQAANSMCQRCQAAQTEYERAMEKAYQTQDPNLASSAQAECWRAMQAASSDTGHVQQYSEAYRTYKLNIQKAIAGADVDDLNFTDLAHISQSLYTVMWTALSLTPTGLSASGLPKQR